MLMGMCFWRRGNGLSISHFLLFYKAKTSVMLFLSWGNLRIWKSRLHKDFERIQFLKKSEVFLLKYSSSLKKAAVV